MMYDVAIVGTGVAGASAALNLQLHQKTIVWFGSGKVGGKLSKAERIANYPGIPMIGGAELASRLQTQIEQANLTPTDRMVTNIAVNRNGFMLLGDNELYEAKALILATGAVNAKGFAGEERLLGHGVSYCATCDGFLYRGKTIAVFCGERRYEHEVAYLAELAKTVYLYTPYASDTPELPNVQHLSSPIAEICGEKRVESVRLTDGSCYMLDGVFVLRSAVAPATLCRGLETDGAHIVADRRCATNIRGCFAAGDCTGRPYQIAKAVGEGNIAAHSVLEYLAALEKDEKGR